MLPQKGNAPLAMGFMARVLAGASVTALAVLTFPAAAQTDGTPPDAISPVEVQEDEDSSDRIVVTGSRVVRDGSSAPTPVTVVSAAELSNARPQLLADAVSQLPALSNSTTRKTVGGGNRFGPGSFLNLRGLGATRTLVLLDGRRTTPTNTTGSSDINLFPQGLISRVDVVTGGASAAYGSDAVAGVVNFVLDTRFEGVKGEIGGGVTERGDVDNYKAQLSLGTSLLDGRLHLLASGSYFNTGGISDAAGRDWALTQSAVIQNPNVNAANPASPTNPRLLRRSNVTIPYASYGGLITAGPLAGTAFGPGGVPETFYYGTLRTNNFMVGGSGPNTTQFQNYTFPLESKSVFGRVSFDVTPDITVYTQAAISSSKTDGYPQTPAYMFQARGFTIFRENAFLPDEIRQRMEDLNLASFPMGRLNLDWGMITAQSGYESREFVAGIDGGFGDSWEWSAYYERGQTDFALDIVNQPNLSNVYNAADAVVDPATGRIVCRTTLTNPNNGCVPINLFGHGSASPEALDYIHGVLQQRVKVTQDVFAADLRGEPFSTWAGPVVVGFGGEYRRQYGRQDVDPISTAPVDNAGIRGFPAAYNNAFGGWQTNNPKPLLGSYDVREGFVEVLIPLARDMSFARSLDFNGAVRVTDYSTSGTVVTWKAGATYEPFDDLRLRFTRSRDIRAPNLNDLYAGDSEAPLTIADPANNGAQVSAKQITSGNAALNPEKADTTTFGAVYQPSWLSGLSLSVDYYDIKIADALASLSALEIVTRCHQGATELCPLVTRQPDGTIFTVRVPALNLEELATSGVDVELSYRTDLAGGERLTFRGFVNYLDKIRSTVPGSDPVDRAGDVGNGQPHWRALGSATFEKGPVSFHVQGRYIGGGKFNSTYGPSDIDDNTVPSRMYADATISYDIELSNGNVELFATVNNLFDRSPPIVTTSNGIIGAQTNLSLYDVEGRSYYAGMRFQF